MTNNIKKYGMLINLDKCIGCYACQVTCKTEHNTSFGTFRCRVEQHSNGIFPDISKFFIPRLCNHCDDPPCIKGCEENALSKNSDGVVLLSRESCTNCRKCFDECPYNAIMTDQYTGEPEKCDFCYSRITDGELPVCAKSCMGKAILFGNMNDQNSELSVALKESRLKVLNPELGTHPSVYYIFSGDCGSVPLKKYELTETHKVASTRNIHREDNSNSGAKLINTSDVMCPSECGISVRVENGIAKKIYGNPYSLINNGTLCAKGASGLQMTYSPHRIKSPLLRVGERGEDRWKEVAWEEATDYIAEKLVGIKKRHGPESVFLDVGDVTDREAFYRLFHAFGTPNTFNHGSICDPNRKWGPWLMTGDERPLPDLQRPLLIRGNGKTRLNHKHDAKLILNIGANPFVATRFNYMSNGIPAAKEANNCKYIVIDPSYTNSAAHADIWLPINPGTDGELLAAMLYYILKNNSKSSGSGRYIDHDFMERYTVGWPEFEKVFLEYTKKRDPANEMYYFTPEWAEEKTGIKKTDIEKIAHLFGITKPASIEIGMHGTAHHTNGDVSSILMTALCLITGNMDRPGGLVFIDSQKAKKGNSTTGRHFLEKTVKRSLDGKDFAGPLSALNKDFFGDHPTAFKGVLADIPQKIRNGIELRHGPFRGFGYPLKAYISRAGNPVITAGNTRDWIDALTLKDESGKYRLELMVFTDTHINVTGKYADIVLPEAGFLERMGVSDVYTISPEVGIRDQVIQPLYESKTDFEMMIALSKALISNGDPDLKAEDFRDQYKDEEAFINEILGDAPGFYNIGQPLPYPDLPEGCRIIGIPDNPTAILDDKVIKEGEPLTVEWLRNNHGVAVWPTSYYRYKKADGSPSGIYPKTSSNKFEFRFSHLEEINKKYGTDYPTSFYWSECKWNPKNPEYKKFSKEYPFQLVTGRVHHSMTMTTVCPYLAETETECMKPVNDDISYRMPETGDTPNTYGLPDDRDILFKSGSVSIPVFAINRSDGERLGLKTGEIITLKTPLKKSIKGKAFLTEEIMPGVIKTAFGPGGQKASGIGFMNKTAGYTPNINDLHDPDNFNRLTGTPGFGDIMVKVIKQVVE
jgi:anaerobic selenocysteine-containing dehydrogenase/Fe-S-cluster-containing dehydrogenase component